MASKEYPLKNIRLEQLHQFGLNVADFICFPPNTLKGREEELRVFLNKHGRISCRHFHADEKNYFKCPFAPDQTDFQEILNFCLEHNKTFYTLCNEAINPKESTCAGNVLILDERNYWVEYFYGPGTPRDVETKGVGELKYYKRSFGEDPQGEKPPEEVLRLAHSASKFQPILGAYMIEFSLYPYPIGRRETNIIVWEWRWGWLHYPLQLIQFLMEQNKKLLEEIKKLKDKNHIDIREPLDLASVYEDNEWMKRWDHSQEA